MSGMLVARLPQASSLGDVVSTVIGRSEKSIVATGVIAAWSGSIATIPDGWALCDGNNGTPEIFSGNYFFKKNLTAG